jgi:hypothetical protein
MKTCLKSLLWVTILTGLILAMYGCITTTDPATGQKVTVIDPDWSNWLTGAANAAEGAKPVLIALSAIWPPLALAVGIITGLVAAWKNLKPKVTQAQSQANQFYNLLGALVIGIESFKKENPADWTKLETKFLALIGPKAEAVIRILRGLPPKAE